MPCYGLGEFSFAVHGHYENPYLDLEATATLVEPDGQTTRQVPLFWDGGQVWRFRFSPDRVGEWRWSVGSRDPGLQGQSGRFICVPSTRRGSLQPAVGSPRHFQYQNGERVWFLGDTAWALLLDDAGERLDRAAIERYLENRARQDFNALHLMMASELGWGNRGGQPWQDISRQQINPAYFQEADERISFANAQGLVAGIAVAWGNKGRNEPYAWSRLPDMMARERYARYVAARYAAYDVYFLVSGEWDAETRSRSVPERQVREEFAWLGDVIRSADPQRRMIGIHPTQRGNGSVREFNPETGWMDFGDYQQNYTQLHGRILESRRFNRPVINAEYAYWLRDADGDGQVDKANSYTLADIRAATWDIAMAGGYVVAGFGSTYLGGARNNTPFLPDDPNNEPWLAQLKVLKTFFESIDYWQLEPHDEWLTSPVSRSTDRVSRVETGDVHTTTTRAPETTYWCLADPQDCYVLYVRGTTQPLTLSLRGAAKQRWQVEQHDPRTGVSKSLGALEAGADTFTYRSPDPGDWVVTLRVKK